MADPTQIRQICLPELISARILTAVEITAATCALEGLLSARCSEIGAASGAYEYACLIGVGNARSSSRGASAGRCAHDEEVRGDPVVRDRQGRSCSMLGQPSSACVTWSGNPRRSRASPSGPCGLSIRPSLVREKSGKASMPSATRLREASTYSRPDFAARRRRWPSRPTRGTASSAWRTAGREAGARGAGGRGAGPSADISLLSRGRGKLGADPVRTLFEHVAGPAGEDGAPGDVLLGAARDPVDRTTTDVPDSEKNAGFGPSR